MDKKLSLLECGACFAIGYLACKFYENYSVQFAFNYNKDVNNIDDDEKIICTGYENDIKPMNYASNSYSPNYTPIPKEVINYIKENKWNIIEMCAGKDGFNNTLLKEADVDIISFDITTGSNENIKYGLAGTVEHNYSDRVLMICNGFECQKSVENYKGNYVIIGGYIIHTRTKYTEYLTDITKPNIVSYDGVEQYNNGFDNLMYELKLRPNNKWMTNNGWNIKHAIFGDHPTDSTYVAYYIYERKENKTS